MSDQVIEQWRVTRGFIALLEAGTGKTVFDGEIKANTDLPTIPKTVDGKTVNVPDVYFVVYEIPGGGLDGTWGAPNEHLSVVYQVTAVGPVSRRQARAAADLARRTIVQRADLTATNDGYAVEFPIDGTDNFAVVSRVLDGTTGGTEPSGNEQVHPFTVPERFRVLVAPA